MIFGRIFNKEKANTETIMSNSSKQKSPDTGESKMSLATKAYLRMIKKDGVQRKDIIKEFIEKCSLTPAGAATYYNTIKNKISKNR
jgi:hypothetical protein